MPAIRKDKLPTYLQQQAYMGSLLGDGSLSKPPKGINYHFEVYHSEKQGEYLEYKHQLFIPYSSPIQHCAYLDKRDGKVRTGSRFHSITHPYFTSLRNLLYDGKRKIITANYLNKINHPIALAILIGDDGSARNLNHGRACGLHIATKQFSESENALIAFWLQTTYNLQTAKVIPAKYPFIAISVTDMPLLRSLTLSHLPKIMHYKLGGGSWEPSKYWVGTIMIKCQQCGIMFPAHAKENRKYCSRNCHNQSKKGKTGRTFTEAQKQTLREWWVIHRKEQGHKISIGLRENPHPYPEAQKQFMRDWWDTHRDEQRIKIRTARHKQTTTKV